MSNERLQKILSQAGLGSRREMERWIEQGLVQVNGIRATLGDSASSDDKISVRGRIIDTNHGYDQVAYDKATSFGENSILQSRE